jgi:hypothetical protein
MAGTESMMGPRQVEQGALFYNFSIDAHVPADHLLIIFKEFPGEQERCILRDLMINKILKARLDEPSDFVSKIPLWLRERTDPRQMRYIKQICEIVETLQ